MLCDSGVGKKGLNKPQSQETGKNEQMANKNASRQKNKQRNIHITCKIGIYFTNYNIC